MSGPNSTSSQPSLVEYALVMVLVAAVVIIAFMPIPQSTRDKIKAALTEMQKAAR